jgi:hypothetical protein
MCTDLFLKFLPLLAKNCSMMVRTRDGGNGHSVGGVQVADGDGLNFVLVISFDAFH